MRTPGVEDTAVRRGHRAGDLALENDSAVPTVDSTGRSDDRIILEGEVPSPVTPPGGCAFHPRCPHAEPKCEETPPPVQAVDGATSRCHFAEDFED